jgi:hypothetical protein
MADRRGEEKLMRISTWTPAVALLALAACIDPREETRVVTSFAATTTARTAALVRQTRLYSQKGWDDLRFTEAAVEAGTLSRKTISE